MQMLNDALKGVIPQAQLQTQLPHVGQQFPFSFPQFQPVQSSPQHMDMFGQTNQSGLLSVLRGNYGGFNRF